MSRFRGNRPERGDAEQRRPGGLPWEPRVDDVGLRVVDKIAHSFTLDAEWSVRDERGFTWWGKDLAQGVWSEPGFDDDGFEIFRLHARTDLLRDFDPTEENLAKLNAFGGFATTSGYLVDARAGTVQLAASMYVHEETEDWVRRSFQLVTAIQAADAQIKAPVLAELTGAAVAASAHPESGARPILDDMLNVLEHVVAPLGRGPSAWQGDQMRWTTDIVQRGTFTVLATGGETGLSAEFPLQSRTSLLTVTTEAENPQLGNGVLLILHLPMAIDQGDGVRLAAELTRRELSTLTRTQMIGAWCWRDDGMHHVTFLPNAMHVGGGDLLNVVVSMSGRAKWVAETLYGDDWMANRDESGRPLAKPAITEHLPIPSDENPDT
jgi:hypothetical protein